MKIYLSALLVCISSSSVQAQTAMPSAITGSWCGIESVGRRIDISSKGYEEGDGMCSMITATKDANKRIAAYLFEFKCDTGVEGKKTKTTNEYFALIQDESGPLIHRQGSLYEPNLKAVYKKCK